MGELAEAQVVASLDLELVVRVGLQLVANLELGAGRVEGDEFVVVGLVQFVAVNAGCCLQRRVRVVVVGQQELVFADQLISFVEVGPRESVV